MEQEQQRKNIGGIRKKDFIKKTKMKAEWWTMGLPVCYSRWLMQCRPCSIHLIVLQLIVEFVWLGQDIKLLLFNQFIKIHTWSGWSWQQSLLCAAIFYSFPSLEGKCDMWDIHYFGDRLQYMFRCVLLPVAHSRYPEMIPLNANTAEVCTIGRGQNVETRSNKIKTQLETHEQHGHTFPFSPLSVATIKSTGQKMNELPVLSLYCALVHPPNPNPPCTNSCCKHRLPALRCETGTHTMDWAADGEQRQCVISPWHACISGPRGGE